jgi:flagellar assembly factor FliW
MPIKLAEIVKLIQIIDSGELEISGKRPVILGFENIKNNLVKTINETFENYDIDEKNVHDFEFTLTKKEEKND